MSLTSNLSQPHGIHQKSISKGFNENPSYPTGWSKSQQNTDPPPQPTSWPSTWEDHRIYFLFLSPPLHQAVGTALRVSRLHHLIIAAIQQVQNISFFPNSFAFPSLLPGPLCSILVKRFGCRFVVMLGGLLSGLGMVSSSFCKSISQLYLTAGLITGMYKIAGKLSCCGGDGKWESPD